MELNYEKTYQIEIINEFSSTVYNRVLNYVLNHELNTKDMTIVESNLLNQLEVAQEVDLFKQSADELKAIDGYWLAMDLYSKKLLIKQKVA